MHSSTRRGRALSGINILRPEDQTDSLNVLAKDSVIRTRRLHDRNDLIRAHYSHDVIEVGKRDRIPDLPVGNGRWHRANAICRQCRWLSTDQLTAAPHGKTSKHEIPRLQRRKRLHRAEWIGYILNRA